MDFIVWVDWYFAPTYESYVPHFVSPKLVLCRFFILVGPTYELLCFNVKKILSPGMTSHANTVAEVKQWLKMQLMCLTTKSHKSLERKQEVCMSDIKTHVMHHDKQLTQQSYCLDDQFKQNELFRRTMTRTKEEVMLVHSTVKIHEEKIDTTWITVHMLSEKVKDLQKVVLDMKQKDVLTSSFFKEC